MGFDPDDFRDTRERDRQREQNIADRARMRDERRQEQERRDREEDERERMEALRKVINDDSIIITPQERTIINDPNQRMMENGEIVKRNQTRTARGAFASQFRFDRIVPELRKKVRKKARKELDRLQAEAFREANKLLRTKTGKLRKGVTQSDVAKRAHKILKRLRKQ